MQKVKELVDLVQQINALRAMQLSIGNDSLWPNFYIKKELFLSFFFNIFEPDFERKESCPKQPKALHNLTFPGNYGIMKGHTEF